MTDIYDENLCPHCGGEGHVDDPLSSAMGGRWFRYCECPAGVSASEEDHSRRPLGYLIHAADMREKAAAAYGDPRVQALVQEVGTLFATLADKHNLTPEEALAAAAGVATGIGITVYDNAADQSRDDRPNAKAFRAAYSHLIETGMTKLALSTN